MEFDEIEFDEMISRKILKVWEESSDRIFAAWDRSNKRWERHNTETFWLSVMLIILVGLGGYAIGLVSSTRPIVPAINSNLLPCVAMEL